MCRIQQMINSLICDTIGEQNQTMLYAMKQGSASCSSAMPGYSAHFLSFYSAFPEILRNFACIKNDYYGKCFSRRYI